MEGIKIERKGRAWATWAAAGRGGWRAGGGGRDGRENGGEEDGRESTESLRLALAPGALSLSRGRRETETSHRADHHLIIFFSLYFRPPIGPEMRPSSSSSPFQSDGPCVSARPSLSQRPPGVLPAVSLFPYPYRNGASASPRLRGQRSAALTSIGIVVHV